MRWLKIVGAGLETDGDKHKKTNSSSNRVVRRWKDIQYKNMIDFTRFFSSS